MATDDIGAPRTSGAARELPRELPQSLGMVAHIWSRYRDPIELDAEAPGAIDLGGLPAAAEAPVKPASA